MNYYRLSLGTLVLLIGSISSVPVLHAQDESETEDAEKLEQVIDEVAETNSKDPVQVGEASYNVEDCRTLINRADNGADDSGESDVTDEQVEELDLDKCRTLIK